MVWPPAFAVLLCACSTLPPEPAPELVWQRVRFTLRWNGFDPPRWHLDAMLADQAAAPLLERERGSIDLWRFHRRAANDAAGHSFSLLTRASRAANSRLCHELADGALVAELRRAKLLDRVDCEAVSADREALVEGTSDPRWSGPLQRAWPHFVMGASETWLALIGEHAKAIAGGEPAPSLEQAIETYRRANEAVDRTWEREAHHALLHHLNALFGYGPIDLGPNERRRF